MDARISNGVNRFESKWKEGCTASLMYWPVVNTFMYGCVTPKFYNLYLDVASLCFSTLMSYIAYKQVDQQVYEDSKKEPIESVVGAISFNHADAGRADLVRL